MARGARGARHPRGVGPVKSGELGEGCGGVGKPVFFFELWMFRGFVIVLGFEDVLRLCSGLMAFSIVILKLYRVLEVCIGLCRGFTGIHQGLIRFYKCFSCINMRPAPFLQIGGCFLALAIFNG